MRSPDVAEWEETTAGQAAKIGSAVAEQPEASTVESSDRFALPWLNPGQLLSAAAAAAVTVDAGCFQRAWKCAAAAGQPQDPPGVAGRA